MRWLARIDSLAHTLRLAWLLRPICDAYDRRLLGE